MVDVCVVHMCTIDSIFVSAEEREARRHFNSRHLSQAALKMQRGGMESAVAAAVGESADGIWHPLGARPLPPAALEPLQGAA